MVVNIAGFARFDKDRRVRVLDEFTVPSDPIPPPKKGVVDKYETATNIQFTKHGDLRRLYH